MTQAGSGTKFTFSLIKNLLSYWGCGIFLNTKLLNEAGIHFLGIHGIVIGICTKPKGITK